MATDLPAFIDPMLARLGQPFDSDKHLFEWKWDGFRAIVFSEGGACRVRSRNNHDLLPRFPELGFLKELPAGCALDGEIVVLEDGRPNFGLLIGRERASSADRIDEMSRVSPAILVAFDLLYIDYEPIMEQPLTDRREQLDALLKDHPAERLLFSEGVVGHGLKLFEQASSQELEGVVAKRLAGAYLPGKRTDSWTKFKKSSTIYCVILGYVPDESGGLKSVIVGTDIEGSLTCVGRVGSGITESSRRVLEKILSERVRETPVVDTDLAGIWVEPGIFCKVSYVEKTRAGMLRAPVFKELIVE